jgi:hypothetical protein
MGSRVAGRFETALAADAIVKAARSLAGQPGGLDARSTSFATVSGRPAVPALSLRTERAERLLALRQMATCPSGRFVRLIPCFGIRRGSQAGLLFSCKLLHPRGLLYSESLAGYWRSGGTAPNGEESTAVRLLFSDIYGKVHVRLSRSMETEGILHVIAST